MIKIHNELTLYDGDHTVPERVLVLLPHFDRDLAEEQSRPQPADGAA